MNLKPLDVAIQLENLVVQKHGQTICQVRNLDVASGERRGIVGPNASGKSTLLRVLAGFETAYDGHCRRAFRTLDCVLVHQTPFLFRGTVLSNVAFGLRARWFSRTNRRRLATVWLERFGIADLANRQATALSGGERRRVALARAFILRPKLLLLDEPFADLDSTGMQQIREALAEVAESTILIASPSELPSDLQCRTTRLAPRMEVCDV